MARSDQSIDSRALVAEASPFSVWLSLLLPKNARSAYFDWYAYLRWVDDLVDGARPGDASSASFLERQRKLIHRERVESDDRYDAGEARLRRLISSDRFYDDLTLPNALLQMLDCIAYDVGRRGRLEPFESLWSYWTLEVTSYLQAIAYFCGAKAREVAPAVPAAQGAKLVHVMRDMAKDVAEQHFNIPVEIAGAYGLEEHAVRVVAPEIASHWRLSALRYSDALFSAGLRNLKEIPNLRYRIIVILLISKYQNICDVLKIDSRESDISANKRKIMPYFIRNLWRSQLGQRKHDYYTSAMVRLGVPTQLGLIGGLIAGTWGRDGRQLAHFLGNLPLRPARRRKMLRRFGVACLLGRVAFAAVAPEAARDRQILRLAGSLYGLWSIAAIELDRVMDDRVIDAAQARRVSADWAARQKEILDSRSEEAPVDAGIAGAGDCFLRLSNAFMTTLNEYGRMSAKRARSDALTDFQAATVALLEGQLRSLGQADAGRSIDWNWYRGNVLNEKNVQFLLAPFNLWRLDEDSDDRLGQLVTGFELLNRVYLHYQLIDDVADLSQDSGQGIVGAPGAFLLSQSTLAKIVTEETDIAQLAKVASSLGLLDDQLVDGAQFDALRCYLSDLDAAAVTPRAHEARLRCALANRIGEIDEDLKTLAERRIEEGAAYYSALAAGKSQAAVNWVLRSGSPHRFVASAMHPARRRDVEAFLAQLANPHLRKLLSILEKLMRHTYSAAQAVSADG